MTQASAEKRKLIEQMLEMQRVFIDCEHNNGVTAEQYWAGEEGHPLYQYKDRYAELARKVVELAHEEQGSTG